MLTVLSVIGTRPEVIKMAPVIAEMARRHDQFRSILCVTGQHREMLDQTLKVFSLRPDYDLDLMRPDQSLTMLTSQLLEKISTVVEEVNPDWILAQGDTTSVFAAALISFYHRIPFAHVEAGLRTGCPHQPFPEEMNRRFADSVSSLWFAPTDQSRQVLLEQGCPRDAVVLTGNTVVDALQAILRQGYVWEDSPLAGIPRNKRLVLITIHRRESFGTPLKEVCEALRELATELAPDLVHLVFPVHPNPHVRSVASLMLSGLDNISLLPPLDYPGLIHLLNKSALVLTDSGGIQEEAPSLGVPVLVLRDVTERPEGVALGIAKLVGTDRRRIINAAVELLRNPTAYFAMIPSVNPYGDGQSAKRIISALLETKVR